MFIPTHSSTVRMIEVNLIGEETDLTHVRKLCDENISDKEETALQKLITLLFDDDVATDEKIEQLDSVFDVFVDGGTMTEVDIKETAEGVNQIKQFSPVLYENIKTVYTYIIGVTDCIEDAEQAQDELEQSSAMEVITFTIPQPNESMKSIQF